MTQMKSLIFGVDYLSFIDESYNVYGVDDPGNVQLNMTYEEAMHRGGALNEVRDTAVHTRSAELTISTGYCDAALMKILSGGTITSLGTSAASITTDTVNGVNTLSGTSATLCTGISTITIVSPTLLTTPTDYYITADDFAEITVTRVYDGKKFSQVTLTASTASHILDSDQGIQISTGEGAVSLTAGEKAYVTARTAITTINQKVTFDAIAPADLSIQATYKHDGYTRQLNVPIIKFRGTMQGESATEFQIQELTATCQWSSSLEEISNVVLTG